MRRICERKKLKREGKTDPVVLIWQKWKHWVEIDELEDFSQCLHSPAL